MAVLVFFVIEIVVAVTMIVACVGRVPGSSSGSTYRVGVVCLVP
jgi:hypothetical protein